MPEMTTRQRIALMYQHAQPDRVPLFEQPWGPTVARWRKEGMGDRDYIDYFGLDRIVMMGVDNSPRYPTRTVKETDEYRIFTTSWGVTSRNWKHRESVPEMIDATVKCPDDWPAAKGRMTVSDDRIPWKFLETDWPRLRDQGAWIYAQGRFGFGATQSAFVGTERTLIALIDSPEWIADIWQTQLDLHLALLDRIWQAGYHFDGFRWSDDMGYKLTQFFSMDIYRELLEPIHRQAIEWAHAKGIPALLHSCGDVRPFVPRLVELGLDGLHPLEVKAGMDPLAVKRDHGDRLLLPGGFNALLWPDVDRMEAAVREWLPILMHSGGYVFGTDHSTPSNATLQAFRRIVEVVKEVGAY